ncbi:MAG: ParB N-terminal domain-containing protein [Treponema sp.]|nr:ParB N-terminal domain-containing protein [Treponema sp.]
MLVKISDIKVKKRVRQDLGDLESLKDSLKTYGLLNPITLNADMELVAGQRRLEAAKGIGWETINAVVLDRGVSKVQQLELELEENNQRKDFSDEELMTGYERLGKLRNPSFFAHIIIFFADLIERIVRWFRTRFGRKEKKPFLPPAPPPTAVTDATAQNLLQ